MNKYQIAWAESHDWFVRAELANSSDGVCITVRDDMDASRTLTFFDFNKLYAWAGY